MGGDPPQPPAGSSLGGAPNLESKAQSDVTTGQDRAAGFTHVYQTAPVQNPGQLRRPFSEVIADVFHLTLHGDSPVCSTNTHLLI